LKILREGSTIGAPYHRGVVLTTRSPPSLHVLVVEDYPDAADSMAVLLQVQFGCQTEVARDGAQALHRAERFRPDLVLLDLGLPGVSGMDVARKLSAMTPRPLIIALTGWSQETMREQAQHAGIDDYVIKPASIERLADAVAEARRRVARRPLRVAGPESAARRRPTGASP
jgi:DNA-binding response OmpR family regulator